MLLSSHLGTWVLSVRAVLVSNQLENESPFQTQDLVTHYGSDKFQAPELMKEALVAIYLAHFILNSKEESHDTNLVELAIKVHKFMRIVRFNCHEVVDRNTEGVFY